MSVKADDLRTIMGLPDTQDVGPFIRFAETVVTDSGVSADADYGTETIEQISLFLSAHIATVLFPSKLSEAQGDGRESYANVLGKKGLQTSRFGQMVAAIDANGHIAAMFKRKIKLWPMGPVDDTSTSGSMS